MTGTGVRWFQAAAPAKMPGSRSPPLRLLFCWRAGRWRLRPGRRRRGLVAPHHRASRTPTWLPKRDLTFLWAPQVSGYTSETALTAMTCTWQEVGVGWLMKELEQANVGEDKPRKKVALLSFFYLQGTVWWFVCLFVVVFFFAIL